MKIAVAGLGYVGLSNAVLIAQNHEVVAVDLVQQRVDLVAARKSPIVDKDIEEFLSTIQLNLSATTNSVEAYTDADFVIVARPTKYDPLTTYFHTTAVQSAVIAVLPANRTACIYFH